MFTRIRCLLIKEVTQIRRDRRLVAMLVFVPVVQLIFFGYAATTDVREIAIAICDQDHTWHSREYVRALAASGYFVTSALSGPETEDGAQLISGSAGLVVVIPRGFGNTLENRRPASVQVLVDGADSNFAVQGLNYLQKATRLFSERLVREVELELRRDRGLRLPAVIAESRAWYNPDLTSRNYMVPGVLGVLLLVTTMIVTSMALVKEREDGTMEQIIVTPLRSGELIAGKLLPFVAIGFVEISMILPVIRFVFGIHLRGSLPLFYLLSGLFLLTTLGLGLLVSTFAKTQQQAMMIAAFVAMLPFVLLSGFIFPVENMPPPIRFVTNFIPMRYYLTIVRGLFLKGVGWHELWRDALALLACGLVILSLAVLKFRKRLD